MANRSGGWGGGVEKEIDFIFLGSRITEDCDCSHKIKTLAPWKTSYEKLSILKRRDITLPTKVHIVKAMVFPAVMYECESWTMN